MWTKEGTAEMTRWCALILTAEVGASKVDASILPPGYSTGTALRATSSSLKEKRPDLSASVL